MRQQSRGKQEKPGSYSIERRYNLHNMDGFRVCVGGVNMNKSKRYIETFKYAVALWESLSERQQDAIEEEAGW